MAQLLTVILYKTSHLPELIATWQAIGVPGVTILQSAGGYGTANWLQRAGLGAISDLFNAAEVQSKTLLAVIEDDEVLEQAIIETERILGDLAQPNSGILFVVPVSRALGISSPQPAQQRTPAVPAPPGPAQPLETEQVTRETPISVINEILNLKPVIVQTQQPLTEVAQAMVNFPNVQVACVVNEQQRLVGLLPLQNLVDDLFMIVIPEEFLGETHDLEDALRFAQLSQAHTAGDAMIAPVWVKEEETLRDAFRKMHDHQLSGIPIVNNRYEVTGYINLIELLATYIGSHKTVKDPNLSHE